MEVVILSIKIGNIEQKPHKQMTIDESSFGYYIGDEMDKFMEEKGLQNQKELFDELYFKIKERFEPHFQEVKKS